MKKTLLLFAISIYSSIPVFSQSYKPFNFEHGEWVCAYVTKGGTFVYYGSDYVHEYVKYYCQGDTLISDTLYKKMYFVGYAYTHQVPSHPISGYYGAVRNDTVNKKVFIKSNYIFDYSVADLLYDFNITIGDPCQYCCHDTSVISSIDSVLYCDTYHKRYNYTDALNYTHSIIEGIGSTFGLTPRHCMVNSSGLLCYSENNVPTCDTCETPAYHFKMDNDYFNIYPNPTHDFVDIVSAFPMSLVEISDISGRIIYREQSLHGTMSRIQLPYKGIYSIRIIMNDVIVTRKVIRL